MRVGAKPPIILGQVVISKKSRAPAYLDAPTIPIAYLQLLLEILGERGIAEARLFGDQVPLQLLSAPRMSAIQWTRLVRRAQELTGDSGLGYEYGLRMRPTAHGLLGYAAMSAGSVDAATDIVVRYAAARQAHFELVREDRAGYCQLTLKERFPIPVMRTFFFENILLGLARGFAVLLGRELADFPDYEICFDSPEPAYYRAYRARLGAVRFGYPVNAVRFPARYLALRPALADPHASEEARGLCEQELNAAQQTEHDLPSRVVGELRRAPEHAGYPSLEQVAARLALSTRTLKRRLQQSGTSFSRLLSDTRTRDACDLLARTDVSIQDIAARLGYENPANFSRAFAQVVGKTPSSYRAQAAAGDAQARRVSPASRAR
ncbi:MAG TPA: AraC family transcriptional regulator ligand-binding domain-containing protein [Polyangiales bacterium]